MRRYDPYVLLGRQARLPPFTDGNFEETKWYPVRDKTICSILTSAENAGSTQGNAGFVLRIALRSNGSEELFERERGREPDFQVWDSCALACDELVTV